MKTRSLFRNGFAIILLLAGLLIVPAGAYSDNFNGAFDWSIDSGSWLSSSANPFDGSQFYYTNGTSVSHYIGLSYPANYWSIQVSPYYMGTPSTFNWNYETNSSSTFDGYGNCATNCRSLLVNWGSTGGSVQTTSSGYSSYTLPQLENKWYYITVDDSGTNEIISIYDNLSILLNQQTIPKPAHILNADRMYIHTYNIYGISFDNIIVSPYSNSLTVPSYQIQNLGFNVQYTLADMTDSYILAVRDSSNGGGLNGNLVDFYQIISPTGTVQFPSQGRTWNNKAGNYTVLLMDNTLGTVIQSSNISIISSANNYTATNIIKMSPVAGTIQYSINNGATAGIMSYNFSFSTLIGDSWSISAAPNAGWKFDHWILDNGSCIAAGYTPPCTYYGQSIQTITTGTNTTTTTAVFTVNTIGGVIYGYILDAETQNPIQGAAVRVNGNTATTDTNGYYSFSNLPDGTYSYLISAKGYTSLSGVRSFSTASENDFGLFPAPGPNYIYGYVRQPSNDIAHCNGADFSHCWDPVSGAQVTIDRYSGFTDSNGYYAMPSLTSNDLYPFTVQKSGFFTSTGSTYFYIGQDNNLTLFINNAPNTSTYYASGFVLNTDNYGIGDALVTISNATFSNSTYASTGIGHYMVGVHALGTYNITASKTGFQNSTVTWAVITSTDPYGNIFNFILNEVPGGNVCGYILSATSDTIPQNATITINGVTASSDPVTGYYCTNITASGIYPYSITADGFYPSGGATNFFTDLGNDFYMYGVVNSTLYISGHVVDTNGTNISGATIAAIDVLNTSVSSGTTDANGMYNFSVPAPGTFNITASKSGYLSQTVTWAVIYLGPNVYNFNLTADPNAACSGCVDYVGNPAAQQAEVNKMLNTGYSAVTVIYGLAGLCTVLLLLKFMGGRK